MDLNTPTLLLAILGIALVDSINPSALLVTGYILVKAPAHRKLRTVLAYIAGIFCLYSIVGILLTFGFAALLHTAGTILESRPVYIVQALIGIGMLLWSFLPPKPTSAPQRLKPTHFAGRSMFALGVAVTGVEFMTALPYVAAIGLLQQAELTLLAKLGILLGYNIIFIMPPLALAVVYKLNHTRVEKWFANREAAQKKPNDTMQWVVGIIGAMLLLNALGNLL